MIQPITSFPRSGSNLTSQYFTSLSGIPSTFIHSPLKIEGSISCIRKPEESIASVLTLKLVYNQARLKAPDLSKNKDILDLFLNTEIQLWINSYKIFYEFLASSGHLLIDYNDLVENPEQKILEVLHAKNIKPLKNPLPLQELHDQAEAGYIVKSSPLEIYKYIFEFTSNKIDNECTEAFYDLCKIAKGQI